MNAVLSQACRQLGWKKQVSAHVLRHSFATEMVQSDVNLVELQRLLGHSSLRTTSIYTHTNEERLIEAVNRGFKEQEGDDHGKRSDL